ncbi:MAG: hypothetical protein ACQESD_07130 [Thermoplasmatota archaeon]
MPVCPNCEYYFQEDKERCPRCGFILGNRGPYSRKSRGTDISSTLSIAFDIFKNNLIPILTFILIPTLIVGALNVFSSWQTMELTTSMAGEQDFSVIIDNMIKMMLITIPLSLMGWLIQILFAGGIVGMAKEGFQRGRTQIKAGFDIIRQHPLGLIGASIIVTLIVSVGLVLCLIPGLIFCYWWLFTIPILLIEGKSIGNAMSESKDFAKHHETLGFTIALIAIVIVISIVISGIFGIFTSSQSFGLEQLGGSAPSVELELTPLFIISTVVQSFVNMTLSAFAITCITVHYLRGRRSFKQRDQFSPGFKPQAPPMDSDKYL